MGLDWLKWAARAVPGPESGATANTTTLARAVPPLPDAPERDARGGRSADMSARREVEDRIDLTAQAAYAIASGQADPRRMSQLESMALADFLLRHRAIDGGDHFALSVGPEARSLRQPASGPPAGQPRDLIAAWQERLSQALGSSDAGGVDLASRALRVLGRVEGGRMSTD